MASLECVSHHVQGLDARSIVNQAPSSPASNSAVAEAAGDSTLIQGTFADAESSPAGNEAEILPSTDIPVNENQPVINESGTSLDIVIAAVEDSPAAPELMEVFRFLDLASETRNRIYRLVLGPPEDPSICLTEVLDCRPSSGPTGGIVKLNQEHRGSKWRTKHKVKPDDLSILLVSKQIYSEAFHVFYTTNCFYFTDTGLLYRFLKNIGYIRRQHLTKLYFLWRGLDAKEAFRLLKTCRRLRLIQFTVPCSHPPGYEALKEVRVETAKARFLDHFDTAQIPPLSIRSHTSCFGDYQCHCLCRRPYEPASNLRELETAMMRPRRKENLPITEEKFDLFKPKREHFKKSEEQDLLQDKASFDDFITRFEQQGKELSYLGRRNKTKEAALNQTLRGPAVDDYFRDFDNKLAEDRRLQRRAEHWDAKRQEEKEAKDEEERERREAEAERREAEAAKELAMQMRRDARELKWKTAREVREADKKLARDARELERRVKREAKEQEKVVAREARAQKKAGKAPQ